MKKILMTLAFALTGLGSAWADDDVTVDPITIPQGSTATLSISLANTNEYRQLFQFVLTLPEGVTVVPNSAKLSNRFNDKADLSFTEPTTRNYQFLCQAGTDVTSISGNSGVIMTVQLLAASTLAQSSTPLTGQLTGIEVTNQSSQAFRPADKTFNITIGAPLGKVTLDENSTDAPTAQNNVDVTVLRTIKANEWSTICLPFAMTGAQVISAFGSDVKIADFSEWSFEGTATNATRIDLTFTSVSPNAGLLANHPYMIKVTSSVSSFTLYNVNIAPNNLPSTSQPKKSGFKSYDASIYGYYAKQTMYGAVNGFDDFFVSGNKFWKRTGDMTIKAYRGSFAFDVILADNADSRMTMSFNEEATGINAVDTEVVSSDDYYNLQGQRVDTPAKGIFIKGGKKILVK